MGWMKRRGIVPQTVQARRIVVVVVPAFATKAVHVVATAFRRRMIVQRMDGGRRQEIKGERKNDRNPLEGNHGPDPKPYLRGSCPSYYAPAMGKWEAQMQLSCTILKSFSAASTRRGGRSSLNLSLLCIYNSAAIAAAFPSKPDPAVRRGSMPNDHPYSVFGHLPSALPYGVRGIRCTRLGVRTTKRLDHAVKVCRAPSDESAHKTWIVLFPVEPLSM